MGLFSKKKKVVKEIDGTMWGHLVNVHRIDVDTLANQMRYVDREGTLDANSPVTFLRVFRYPEVQKRGIEITGWETFDQHPDLILFEGYFTKNNRVHLEPKNL